jgi:hypothetical protein
MRRAITCALILLLCAGSLGATDYVESPFVPMSPDIMARGGSIVADVHGYNAFFYNPAGYSRDEGSFTLSALDAWVYSRPDLLLSLGEQFIAGTSTQTGILNFMNDQVTGGGVGAGASFGMGYVGNGLGLGMVIIVDSFLRGSTLLGMSGDLTGTVGFIGGLSLPFELGGFTIHLGGDVRPMVRVHAPLTSAVALSLITAVASQADILASLSLADALYGVGIGMDLGAIAELGWFTVGISIRDLFGTAFRYETDSFGRLSDSLLTSLSFPATGSLVSSDTYTIPMTVAAGVAFHPDLGSVSAVVDPSLSVDLSDLVSAVSGASSIWTLLHVGADLRLFSLFSLRGGLNQGYITLGAGVKLVFLDLDFAIFTRELGAHVGDRPCSGATLGIDIRF